METYQIKDRNGKVIFKSKTESFKECVEIAINENANLSNANLSNANLSHANLINANLYNANLSNANLYDADLSDANLSHAKGIISIKLDGYDIYVQHKYTKIGCKYLTNEKWLSMSIEEAEKLGVNEKYYKIYKSILENNIKILDELKGK